tara:strand:+ start:125 stop:457 length:333 start_codon:yes stop_codon:yes gene_type:complete
MIAGVETAGAAASCGDINTGSLTVFAEGKGITRVGIDTAGGLISGPGSLTVFVEGYPVSLPGDAIVSHGESPHDAATTCGEIIRGGVLSVTCANDPTVGAIPVITVRVGK